ncbi:MAG: GGDEF domain-containing protein [Thiobacillaceae bacterium]|nr:GGDEF domain-containing protein [Thiobacillaceae bacterium]
MTEPTTADAFLQAQELAKRALALLIKSHIPPTPPHYAVSYAYFQGLPAEVHEIIQECIHKGEALTDALLRTLYECYLLPDGYERIRSVRSDLEQLLKTLLKTLKTADAGNQSFQQALQANIEALARAEDSISLQEIAQSLLAAAQQAQAEQRKLAEELDSAREELKKAQTEIEHHRRAAQTDPLTGLYNRRGLEQVLQELWSTTPTLSMLVADIDHFKKINDTYGHQVGDVVIRQVAETLRRTIRGEDYAARYGGEEFVLLLPDTGLPGAAQVAENIRARVAKLRLVRKSDHLAIDAFTISVGVAARRSGEGPEDLFKRADEAVYASKRNGRNRVTVLE